MTRESKLIDFLLAVRWVGLAVLLACLFWMWVSAFNEQSEACTKKGGAWVLGHCLVELR